jgi:hypothetical protein
MNLAMGRCYLLALDIEVGKEILWDCGMDYAFDN